MADTNVADNNSDAIEDRYARVLQIFVIVAFALLLAGFVLFATGVLPSLVEPQRTAQLWSLSSTEFRERTDFPAAWQWVGRIANGDVLTFASLALIAAATPVCFVFLAVMYARRRDTAYTVMVIAVVAILVLAASGLIGVSAH